MEIREEARAVSPPNYSTTINRCKRASLLRFPKNYRSCDPYTLLYTYDCFSSLTFCVSSRPRSGQSRSRSCRWSLKKAMTSTKGARIGRSISILFSFPLKDWSRSLPNKNIYDDIIKNWLCGTELSVDYPLISVVRLFSERVRIVAGNEKSIGLVYDSFQANVFSGRTIELYRESFIRFVNIKRTKLPDSCYNC